MNKLATLAAISMFAVIMGMSAIAPAIAAPNNEKSQATTAVCHYFEEYLTEIVDGVEVPVLDIDGNPVVDEENSAWDVLFINEKGLNGHAQGEDSDHNDLVIGEEETLEEFEARCALENEPEV